MRLPRLRRRRDLPALRVQLLPDRRRDLVAAGDRSAGGWNVRSRESLSRAPVAAP
jgi:hypothetical protein